MRLIAFVTLIAIAMIRVAKMACMFSPSSDPGLEMSVVVRAKAREQLEFL
jgi:hypothetical protein